MSTSVWAEGNTGGNSYSTQPIDFYYPEDIDGHWAAEALDDLISADIVKGYDQGEGTVQLKPNNAITRAEFVSLLVRALDLKAEGPSKTFADVKKGQWFYNDVTTAASLGIVGGINTNQFAPTAKIKRDEIAALIVRAFSQTISFGTNPKTFKDVPVYWATADINKASSVGIVNGTGPDTFSPYKFATRAEALVILRNSLHLEKSNLPSDEELISTYINNDKEFMDAVNNMDVDKMASIYEKYYTGFIKADSEDTIAELKDMKEFVNQGYEVKLQVVATKAPIVEVENKWNRFAVLSIKDK
jgi:hypothetical protein